MVKRHLSTKPEYNPPKHSQKAIPVSGIQQDGVFRKSSFSDSGGCVEVAKFADGSVQVRDTKDPAHTTLTFTTHEWAMFLKGVRNNEFETE